MPVILSYLAVTETECIWFLQEEIVDETIAAYLKENNITTRPYDDVYDYVTKISEKRQACY